ncbi:MAG: hypothetical protein KTQ49_05440, partial [Candidatus Omnitrophica bacterium]|nr:hypothetical protein [Candidatus Omnitrophota bacterium]
MMEQGPSLRSMIGFSWEAAKAVLFPFRFKRWFKIVIIVWLAAAGVQGCGVSNFKLPSRAPKTQSQIVAQEAAPGAPAKPELSEENAVEAPAPTAATEGQGTVQAVSAPESREKDGPSFPAFLILGGILLAIAGWVLTVWLNSRFHFVLLNVLTTREDAVRVPFARSRDLGNSYFKWSLVFSFWGIGAAVGVGTASVFLARSLTGWPVLAAFVGVAGGLLTVASIVSVGIVLFLARDFVAPVMYRENVLIGQAWDTFLRAVSSRKQKVLKYVFVVMGLAIVAMVLQTVVGLIVFLAGLIGGGLLAIPGLILIKILPFLKSPLVFLRIITGTLIVLAALVTIQMILLPVAVFFRMFALTYL